MCGSPKTASQSSLKQVPHFDALSKCVLSVIVKRKCIRSSSIERERSTEDEQPASGRRVTAALSDVFEANWSFYRCKPDLEREKGRCRAVGIDNESDQVP